MEPWARLVGHDAVQIGGGDTAVTALARAAALSVVAGAKAIHLSSKLKDESRQVNPYARDVAAAALSALMDADKHGGADCVVVACGALQRLMPEPGSGAVPAVMRGVKTALDACARLALKKAQALEEENEANARARARGGRGKASESMAIKAEWIGCVLSDALTAAKMLMLHAERLCDQMTFLLSGLPASASKARAAFTNGQCGIFSLLARDLKLIEKKLDQGQDEAFFPSATALRVWARDVLSEELAGSVPVRGLRDTEWLDDARVEFAGACVHSVIAEWKLSYFGNVIGTVSHVGDVGGGGAGARSSRATPQKRRRAGDTSDNAIEIYDTDDSDEW
jgi:hypothetical protein